jgi:hypothetical protein
MDSSVKHEEPAEVLGSDGNTQSSTADTAIDGLSQDDLPRLQTHFEVLWRTLCANVFEKQYPAPLRAGHGFVRNLEKRIQHLFYSPILMSLEEHKLTAEKEQSDRLSILKTLGDSEYEGFQLVTLSEEKQGERQVNSTMDSRFAGIPKSAIEGILTKFIPNFNDAMEIIFRNVDEELCTLWRLRFGQVMPGRKLFRTKRMNLLGIATTSLAVGDLLAILPGSRVPLLLRSVPTSKDREFRVVGEAYVHGMMNGEALEYENFILQDLTLA